MFKSDKIKGMSDDQLYDKTEALLKGLLSVKPINHSEMPAAIKGATIPTPKLPSKLPDLSLKAPKLPKATEAKLPKSPEQAAKENKIPGGLPPASKKDPQKVAEQLKNPNPTKLTNPQEEVLKVASNGQWSLEKVELDPSHGITFQHEHHDMGGVGDLTHIKAIHPVHGEIGSTLMEHRSDGTMEPQLVNVNPKFRRMGIASAMYGHAQNLHNKKVVPSRDQTPMGQALWAGNKAKPQFG